MKVKELLTDESKWCRQHYALDASGLATHSRGEDAVCWCLAGAVNRCYVGTGLTPDVYEKLDKRIRGDWIQWNDDPNRTFAEVRALIEELDI